MVFFIAQPLATSIHLFLVYKVRTAKERAWREIRKFFVASDPTNSNVSVSQLKVNYTYCQGLMCSNTILHF